MWTASPISQCIIIWIKHIRTAGTLSPASILWTSLPNETLVPWTPASVALAAAGLASASVTQLFQVSKLFVLGSFHLAVWFPTSLWDTVWRIYLQMKHDSNFTSFLFAKARKGRKGQRDNKVIRYPSQGQSLFLSLSPLSYHWLYANKLLTVTSPWDIRRGHRITFFNISIYQNGVRPGFF